MEGLPGGCVYLGWEFILGSQGTPAEVASRQVENC